MIEAISIGTNKYGAYETVRDAAGNAVLDADGNPVLRGTTSVNLYSFGEATNLTLGQLVNAVCCRAGTALESQSVGLVNLLSFGTRRLRAASKVLQTLVDGTEKGYATEIDLEYYGTMTARKFLTEILGYTIEERNSDGKVTKEGRLPDEVIAENDRLKLYAAMKEKLDSMTTESQQRMIDLQSCMARRDVAYSSATNIVQTLGGVLQSTAANF